MKLVVLFLSLLFFNSECAAKIYSPVIFYLNQSNFNKIQDNQKIFNDDEFEITQEWIDLCLEKNKYERLILKNFQYLKSASENPSYCSICKQPHKHHLVVWHEEYTNLIQKMEIVREKLINEKNSRKENTTKIVEQEVGQEIQIEPVVNIDYLNDFPFAPLFVYSKEQISKEFKIFLEEERKKTKAIELQDSKFFNIALTHSNNRRFEEAVIYLKKISKNFSQKTKVDKLLALNKLKLANQIAYNNKAKKTMKARENFASLLEKIFLEDGMDTTVTVEGEFNQILRINYIFSGRVFCHRFNQSLASRKAKSLGFTHAKFESDYSDDVWTITYR